MTNPAIKIYYKFLEIVLSLILFDPVRVQVQESTNTVILTTNYEVHKILLSKRIFGE